MSPCFKRPVDVLAFLQHAFGASATSDVEAILKPINAVMDRIILNTPLEYDDGVFYIIAGILVDFDCLEYGTSIRSAWPTLEGAKLRRILQSVSPGDIEDASGRAYDGMEYGVLTPR